ncbi:MAG: 2-isopropylmalate synthase [Natronomonas sp.]|uniref:Probable 2-isopropylmalate synthase n=1 Tax=Natronomonas salsuginis TaxID=2217661 RepID=A0A4U5JJC7_9EURY|nr:MULTISPECIES: 2-isopropylmalate synthase [Natronomonas]MDR9381444.1 2-isopropylmalate synthase [Natronomonas sp.]MDR9429827.1 2-isopropylmalate synthase [Natronomonas sp.]TKR27837.1 2-isopropylmalate synthase [Natronomonas salsuginis]
MEFFQGTLDSTSEISEARIFDTTLRDGEQSPRTSFSYEDKREIASILDDMGTHVIEAGFPVNSDAEFEAVRDIADATSTTVCGLARVVDKDIDAALDSGVEMVHVFASTSDVQLQDSMHATRQEALERSVDAVERVKEAGATCMYSPMDVTRTEESFVNEVVEAVSEAGADWINLPDTVGVATPRRFYDMVENVVAHTDARVDVHTHDDFGLASANAISGYEAGASQAQVSVNGIGERAGNAAYEEVVMALESLYDVDTGIDTRRITELSKVVEEKSDMPIPANKPIVGSNAFSHESGIHAAGVIENSDTFEPGVMTPEMVGATRQLVLGKHTGTHSVRERLEDAGFEPTDAEVREVTRLVKDHGAQKEQVTFERLKEFAREVGVRREEVRI